VDRPTGLQDVEVARISRQMAYEGLQKWLSCIYIALYVTYMCTHFSALWCVVVVPHVLSEEV